MDAPSIVHLPHNLEHANQAVLPCCVTAYWNAGMFQCWNPAEVLQDLAHDLVNGQYADKERAVAMLSSMTMYIDHHEVLLESGVLPALMGAVSNPKVEPTVSTSMLSQSALANCSCKVLLQSKSDMQLQFNFL